METFILSFSNAETDIGYMNIKRAISKLNYLIHVNVSGTIFRTDHFNALIAFNNKVFEFLIMQEA